ncbi:DUF4259 domain-containing protein [Kitasatospora sp. NPDC059646]|uniref:DUF4259 domain-containing protein n=1 Tax=Kitasatospora sp. NPDC059646 TaxID=3346893 RepID=UPI00369603DF
MGAWATGPFDNDTAADFAGDLDAAAPELREGLVRAVLGGGAAELGHLDAWDGDRIVAAAALVASQCPGGGPVSTAYGPDQPLPVFDADLRRLALDAPGTVLGEDSELAELWDDADRGADRRREVERLRAVLHAASAA